MEGTKLRHRHSQKNLPSAAGAAWGEHQFMSGVFGDGSVTMLVIFLFECLLLFSIWTLDDERNWGLRPMVCYTNHAHRL